MSVNHRHAPETRYPAAVEDTWAALHGVVAHAVELGGTRTTWSSLVERRGNLVAVTQRTRDRGTDRA